jgi:uncharacterized repeat protein (TIGR01451 family)
MMKRILPLVLGFILVLSAIGLVRAGSTSPVSNQTADRIDIALLEELSNGSKSDFIVRFAHQVDLSPAYDMDWEARGDYVYHTLMDVALLTQSRALDHTNQRGLTTRTFIAGNELYVSAGDLRAAKNLAGLPEVESIRAAGIHRIPPVAPGGPDAREWNIIDTGATQFWSVFGLVGSGIKVANIDTGVAPNHPALDAAYACGDDYADAECWEDPANICLGSMCDNNGHGTHTMGTMVGDDGGNNAIGIAPGATWISCKGCEGNTCSDFALGACADWILAPGGNPANRPHIVNNSWGDSENCNDWYLPKINAWRAAGIFPAFSAGNYGSGCDTLGTPGDLQEAFASTAHDNSRAIYALASRGPSCYGHEPYTKPNISAPGVSVRSAWVGGGYWSLNGTSMASPHTAGAVALLWSCNPSLIGNIDQTFQILQDTAAEAPSGSCDAPPDEEGNYTFGYGYLDVYQAGLSWCSGGGYGWLSGEVTVVDLGEPLPGVEIKINPGDGLVTTGSNGLYSATLLSGTYVITASREGYRSETIAGISVITGATTTQDFQLEYLGSWRPGPSDPPFQYTRFDGVFNPEDNLIYFLGGRTGPDSHDKSIWTYNPASDQWADSGCQMNHNASNITIALLDDDGTGRGIGLYLIGGYDVAAGTNLTVVQRYYPSQPGCLVEDVSSDPFPVVLSGHVVSAGGVGAIKNRIYYFGGWQSEVPPYFSDQTWEFDPRRSSGSRWSQLPAVLDPARSYINVAVLDDLIYAMGGISGYDETPDLIPTAVVEVFDPADPDAGWTPLASMPIAMGEGQGFAFQAQSLEEISALSEGRDGIYVAGGGDWPDESAEALAYDVVSDTWDAAFPDLLFPRRNHAGALVPLCTEDPDDGLPALWVFGGVSGSDDPPYARPEYFPLPCKNSQSNFAINKSIAAKLTAIAPGDVLTYTLIYTNSGMSTALGVFITDSLPSQLAYVSSNPSGTYITANHQVVWNLDIISQMTSSIDLVARVKPSTPIGVQVKNNAKLVWSGVEYPTETIFIVAPPPMSRYFFPTIFR